MHIRFLFALLLLAGCSPNSPVAHRPGEPDVVYVDDSDAAMNTAIDNARETVDGFIDQIPKLQASGAYFSVKVPLEVQGGIEHIWLDAPTIKAGVFEGPLGNVPIAGSYRLGDRVTCSKDRVSDWMAVVDYELFGGYTILAARAHMSKAERETFDQSFGLAIPGVARAF